eukprot:Phypoly_transcript_10042.p1 GENE.Phypoly_transcript_10042~~Phypoly_transcript_10042.p1  ORF type:complete len:392 (+),score=27.49 Phypoly_transcript_10042:136-1311(+)
MPKKQPPPYSGPVEGTVFVRQSSDNDKNSPLSLFTEDDSFRLDLKITETFEDAGITLVHNVNPELRPRDLVSNLLLGPDGRVIDIRGNIFRVKVAPKVARHKLPLYIYKPLSYPDSPKRTNDDKNTPYHHLYFKQTIERLPTYGIVTQIQSVEERRHTSDPKRGFIRVKTTHEDGSVYDWFVKVYSDRDSFEIEEENNRVLSVWQFHRNITTLLTATFHFRGRFMEGEPHQYFLVFRYIDHVNVSEVGKRTDFSDVDIGRGLLALLNVVVRTVPSGAGLTPDMSVVRFWHKDLHEGQVLFDVTTKQCFLADFGNSHLEYLEGRKRSIIGSSSSTPSEAEHEKILVMFKQALKHRFKDSPVTAEVKALKGKIKGRLCKMEDLNSLTGLLGCG